MSWSAACAASLTAFCSVGSPIDDNLRQLVLHLGSKANANGCLPQSAQHFRLADNLAACSSGQTDDSAEVSTMLEQHWRLLKTSSAFGDEGLSEGMIRSAAPESYATLLSDHILRIC